MASLSADQIVEGLKAGQTTRPIPICFRASSELAEMFSDLDRHCNRPPWTRAMFAGEFNSAASRVYGVRGRGETAGFLAAQLAVDEAHILNFGIAPKFRGYGFGRNLLAYALLDLHRAGARWATLEVRRSNATAQNLYRSCGFHDVGLRERYYSDDQEDAIVMSLAVAQFARQILVVDKSTETGPARLGGVS